MLLDAGCRKKVFEMQDGHHSGYHWNSTGDLLATGVCIMDDYKKHFPPEDGFTKVYSTIYSVDVRDVNAKRKTISIDFTLTMQWLDSRIKTDGAYIQNKGGEITLDPTAIEKMWSPDLHILNRKSFKIKEEWASLITARILFKKTNLNHLEGKNNTEYELAIPTVKMKYEVKTTVYCKEWTYIDYPMDNQTCKVMFGSASASSIFRLYKEPGHNYSHETTYKAVNFNITIDFFDQNIADGNTHVAIKIAMSRLTTSFFLKYYAPCIAIVLVSEIGFLIPVSAIPGRVALLVTQFLTLVNLFIHQMVSTLND